LGLKRFINSSRNGVGLTMLNIHQLNQYYGQSHTLWDLDLIVPEGECTVLMGRNGVGKTTLLQCIMGLLPISSGDMLYQGEAIQKKAAEQRAVMGIGYVPQGRQIFPLLTVEENLQMGLPARKDGKKTIPELIYELFPVLRDMRARRGGDLSGGQQQQLAIGRALVTDPQLLILDEPTEGIQPNIVAEIGGIINRLNQEIGLTVLLVEQKLPFARHVADTFCILDRGRVVASGKIDALNQELVQQYLTV
jgi:urea transport system ATP-binding protein